MLMPTYNENISYGYMHQSSYNSAADEIVEYIRLKGRYMAYIQLVSNFDLVYPTWLVN